MIAFRATQVRSLARPFFAGLLLTAAASGQTTSPPPAPVARVAPVTDDYFGTKVVDPYRWMEQPDSPEFAAWLKGQAEHTNAVLAGIPGRAQLVARVQALGDASVSVRGVQRAGDRFFFFKTDPGEDNRKLFVRDVVPPLIHPVQLLLDPTKLGTRDKHVSIDYFSPSPDGKIVAVGYSEGGSENSVMHFLDASDGHEIAESIDRCQLGGPTWRPDGKAVFYNRLQKMAPGAPITAKYQNSRAWLHVLGTDPEKDVPMLGRGLTPGVDVAEIDFPNVAVSPASPWAVGMINHGVRNELTLYIAPLASLDGPKTPWQKLVDVGDDVTGFDLFGDDLYLLSHHGASRFQVLQLKLPANDLKTAVTLVPASEAVLTEVRCAADALYIRNLDGGLSNVFRLPYSAAAGATSNRPFVGLGPPPFTGVKPTAIKLPFAGSIDGLTADPLAPGVVFSLEGWIRSPVFLGYDPSTGSVADTGLRPPSPLDFSKAEAIEVKAKAADGTMVPLSIIANKGQPRDGSAPVLMEGYGAYGVTIDPYFDPTALAWLERGGVIAYAHVRGGGEYGEDWHVAGQKLTKPNTWNDFIACGEYLVAQKWTSPAHLGGMGTSAGGILIGRAITTRPDLFGAAIIDVGVSNALRAENSMNGPDNVPEFGTTTEPDGYRGLAEMDALHHVVDKTAYPAVMLITGANDPRVAPWQVGKMAARLQAASDSGKPILLRVDYDAGHGIGSTKAQRLKLRGDIFAFLLWQLGAGNAQPPKS
jgi:prolyl oligopeptidase